MLAQVYKINYEDAHHEDADRNEVDDGVSMNAIDCTDGWNRKEHEVEEEVLGQMKLKKAITNVHLRLPVNFLNLVLFPSNLLLGGLGGFVATSDIMRLIVINLEPLDHSLLVDVLFVEP